MYRWNLAWLVGIVSISLLGFAASRSAPLRSKERDRELADLVYQVLEEVDHNYVRELDDDAKRIGLRLFRVEGGIAALQIVVLTRRVGKKGTAELGGWKERLTAVHRDQIYPSASAQSFSPALFRVLVVAMVMALMTSTLLGIILAFRTSRRRGPVWLCLGLGILMPVLLLWLGQKR